MGELEQALGKVLQAALPTMIHAERGRLYHVVIAQLERPLLGAVLAQARGNQLEAARILGINRNTLRKRLRTLGLFETRMVTAGAPKN
jgi:two-component system nitrogen regulation response regulator GlnG